MAIDLTPVIIYGFMELYLSLSAVITSCTADIGISGCDDAEGCTYNATYAANGTSVRFTVTVRTDTWVGIGFSLDRFMVSDSRSPLPGVCNSVVFILSRGGHDNDRVTQTAARRALKVITYFS